jgi:tRNA-dihydrouridine synthase
MKNILIDLPKPFFVLAPMDDVADTVFRQIVAICAKPDLYFTEFVNADGLQSAGRPKLLKKLKFTDTEQPLIAQLWGKDPENFFKTARQISDGTFAKELGLPEGVNFAGVDLNMGCPQKNEVKNGTCSALMNDRPLADQIIQAAKEGLDNKLPISVKTRLGFSEIDMTWIEFLLSHNLDMLSIHGRTKSQMSKVPANWEAIGEVSKLRDKIAPGTLIVGNGDVQSREDGIALAEKYNLDGIMIGRGVFNDPYVFSPGSNWENADKSERINLYKKHVELFAKCWPNKERNIQTLNKFCKTYIQGFEGAKEFREILMEKKSFTELLAELDNSRFVAVKTN